MNERDTIGGVENVEGRWSDSPLVELQKRASKLEESVAVLTELVQGLVKRIEGMEGDPFEDDDWDEEDEIELDEDEEDESDL